MFTELEILIDECNKVVELNPMASRLLLKVTQMPLTEVVDLAFVTDRLSDHINELKKTLDKVSSVAQTCACILMVQEQKPTIKTDMCSATIATRTWYKIPYKRESNPELFDSVLTGLGIPKEVAEKELVRLHAPVFAEYAGTQDAPPKGLENGDISSTELYLKMRKSSKFSF